MFVPEIVPKARGTSQHNLKSKTQQIKQSLGFWYDLNGCKLQEQSGNTFKRKVTTKS